MEGADKPPLLQESAQAPESYGALPNNEAPKALQMNGEQALEAPMNEVDAKVPHDEIVRDLKSQRGPWQWLWDRYNPRALDSLLWWMGLAFSISFLCVAAWVWQAYPVSPITPRHFNPAFLLGLMIAGIAPCLLCLQLAGVALEVVLPGLKHDAEFSKQLLMLGISGLTIMVFGRFLMGRPVNYFDQRGALFWALAASNLSLLAPLGLFDKWWTLLALQVLFSGTLAAGAVVTFVCLLSYMGEASAASWDWWFGGWWEYIVKDAPIVICSVQRELQCGGWTSSCSLMRAVAGSAQCPRCPYQVPRKPPCALVWRETLQQRQVLFCGIAGLTTLLLVAFAILGIHSLYRLIRRMSRSSPTAADFKPGYWLTCTDLQQLQRALVPEENSRMNDPQSYTMVLEHIAHVQRCYSKEEAERLSLLKGQQRWHFTVTNAGDHTSSGFHWGVALWDGRTAPRNALIIDPYPHTTNFSKAVDEGRNLDIAVKLSAAGKQKCSWRCGYFSLWWAMWLDLQEEPPIEGLPRNLPPMPGKFPALCWALLSYMTDKKVQLRVSDEFRASVLQGNVNLDRLQASEIDRKLAA